MKKTKIIVILLGSALLLSALCGCGSTPKDNEKEPTEGDVGVVWNAKSFDSSEALAAESGIALKAPEKAKDALYILIGGDIADIKFTFGGENYCLRAAIGKTDTELHGVYLDFSNERSVSIAQNAVALYDDSEGGRLACWSIGEVNYSLTTTSAPDDETLTKIIAAVLE